MKALKMKIAVDCLMKNKFIQPIPSTKDLHLNKYAISLILFNRKQVIFQYVYIRHLLRKEDKLKQFDFFRVKAQEGKHVNCQTKYNIAKINKI